MAKCRLSYAYSTYGWSISTTGMQGYSRDGLTKLRLAGDEGRGEEVEE